MGVEAMSSQMSPFVRGVLAERGIHIEQMQPLRALGLELCDRLRRRDRVDDVAGLGGDPRDHLAFGYLDFREDQHGAEPRRYCPYMYPGSHNTICGNNMIRARPNNWITMNCIMPR